MELAWDMIWITFISDFRRAAMGRFFEFAAKYRASFTKMTVCHKLGIESRSVYAADRSEARSDFCVTEWLNTSTFMAVLVLILACLFPALCLAVNKNGVSPNTISLPSGPGSIEGLGEAFQPTLNTGTGKYAIQLQLPPGTAGHAPGLSLNYEGGSGNGPLGFGWRLPIAYIQRQSDKGIPGYVDSANSQDDDQDGWVDEADELDVFINDMKEELVLQDDGYSFCENEGAFIRYRRVKDEINDYWEGTLPDGTLMEFGLSAEGRIVDAESERAYCWLLQRSTDTNGNTIVYSYSSFAGSENTNQKYLKKVEYGPGAPPWENFHFAAFVYKSRQDWFEDCRSGFVVRTGQLLEEIVIGTQGPDLSNLGHLEGDFSEDGGTDFLNRKYVLRYEANDHWSLLTSVTLVGANGISTLPSSRFGYTLCDPPDTLSTGNRWIGSVNDPLWVMDNDLVELVDLNGDALPDILKTQRFGGAHRAYINQGEVQQGGAKAISWSNAQTVSSADELAWNVDLASQDRNIVHLADMDGDGLADLVYKSGGGDGAGSVYNFRNLGISVGWGQRKRMANQDDPPPSPFGRDDVRTADIDFDKRIDIIQSISVGDGASYQIWFNLGNQKYSRRTRIGQEYGFLFPQTGVHIADINGDRVPDILRIRPQYLVVTAGLGYGNFAPPIYLDIPDLVLDDRQIQQAKIQDITGDGLADLVVERASPGTLWYWINMGNYTLSTQRMITGLPNVSGDVAIRWADLNGNGTTDLVYASSESEPRILTVDLGELIGCDPGPNLMVSIDNGIGRKTIIEYSPSTRFALADAAAGNPWPDPMPFPVSVVSAIKTADSLGNLYITRFTYHNGYYDAAEKEFRGFAWVEQIDVGDESAPTLVTQSHFNTGRTVEALKGKTLQVEARNVQGEVFYKEKYIWVTRILMDRANGDGRNVTFPYQVVKTRDVLERGNGTPAHLEWEYEYDNYGNMIRQVEYGRTDEGWDDERVTEMSYTAGASWGQALWILSEVVERTTKDVNGTIVARKQNYYDGSSNPFEVTKANLTMVKDWVAYDNPEDKYVVSVRNDYDAYGSVAAIYDPLYGQAPGHYRELIHDSTFHTYPVQEIIYMGKDNPPTLTFSATYDYGFGVFTSSTDFNGFTTHYSYDTFGRLMSIIKPPDADNTVEYDYILAHDLGDGKIINWVETRQRDGSAGDGSLHSRTFYDGLSRSIMTRAEGESPGQIVVTDTVKFNARKLPWKKYLPYFETGTLDFAEPKFNSGFTEHFYDAVGREIRVNRPAGPEGVVYFTITYEPLNRIIRDEEQTNTNSPHHGSGMRFVEDGLLDDEGSGRLREVYEIVKLSDTGEWLTSPVEWQTNYSYDILGNLIEYTDSQGNKRIFEYDGLSRRSFMNDPDRGTMSYIYDQASNLIETIDAKEQRIIYEYDGVNRLVSEDYLDEEFSFSSNLSPDVTYGYDAPYGLIDLGDGSHGTASNTRGYLAWVRDLSGEEHISYDARGRVDWVVKRVKDPSTGLLVSYKTEMSYDSMDRIRALIYPDNDRVFYTFNNRGLLEEIQGGPNVTLLSGADYNPSGQVSRYDFGNGVTTTHTFDERLRLSHIDTYRADDPGNPLLSYQYIYDGVSHILRISDLRPETVIPANDPRRNTQIFDYDDLYRLTGVTYSFATPGQPDGQDGSIAYRYDRIGKMLSKTSGIVHSKNGFSVTNIGQMTYGGTGGRFNRIGRSPGNPPGPGALTYTNNDSEQRVIDYDGNGNMTSLEGKIFTWDFKDRLTAVENEKMRAEYIYDYTDRRIVKKVIPKPWIGKNVSSPRESDTVYIERYFEIRDGQPVKYVYAGNNRVARVTGTIDKDAQRIQRLILHPSWNLVAIAIASDSGLGDVSNISEAYRWDNEAKEWVKATTSQPVAQGEVLWLFAEESTLLTLKGTYVEPELPLGLTGGVFYGGVGLEEIPLEEPPSGASLWFFDNTEKKWLTRLGGEASFLSDADAPKKLCAGQALFVQAEGSVKIMFCNRAANVLYYHRDHLDSSNVTTDNLGTIHSEENYYPFGVSRAKRSPSVPDTHYRFTDKEQDNESGNYYLGARYYNAALGRFLSVEPLLQNPSNAVVRVLSGHAYAYSRNNPVILLDVDGRKEKSFLDILLGRGRMTQENLIKSYEENENKPLSGNLKRKAEETMELNRKYGTFYGFAREQRDEIYGGAAKSAAIAEPIAETIAQIATLPFAGGASSAGTIGRLGASASQKTILASFIDTLGKESLKLSVDILAGKKVDISKRAQKIATSVAVKTATGGLSEKLTPYIEKGFAKLASRLSSSAIAETAIDRGIIKKNVNDLTGNFIEQTISAGRDLSAE